MDSLLASYASSDDDADEAPPAPAPGPARGAKPPTAPLGGGGGGGGGISLPQPKSAPLFSSLPAPKSGPAFAAIPAPKSSGNPRCVFQYCRQPIRQPTGDSSDDEEEKEAAKKRRASAAEARPTVSAGSGPVSFFRRLEDEHAEQQGFDAVAGLQHQQGFDAGAGQHHGYDAGVGSTSGYEGYAWNPKFPTYYALYRETYSWDPSGNANYATGSQYAAYGGEQGGGYVHSHGGEHSGGSDSHVVVPPYVADYTGGYRHEAAVMTLPLEVGRIGGKRGRNDKSKLSGLAFGPSYQPAPSEKGKSAIHGWGLCPTRVAPVAGSSSQGTQEEKEEEDRPIYTAAPPPTAAPTVALPPSPTPATPDLSPGGARVLRRLAPDGFTRRRPGRAPGAWSATARP